MKTKELRQLPGAEQDQKLASLRRELFGLRGRAETGKLDKPSTIRIVRRDIARLMTLIGEGRRVNQTGPVNAAVRGTKSGKTG